MMNSSEGSGTQSTRGRFISDEGPPLPAVSLAGMMQMQDMWQSRVGREQITD